MDDPPQPPTAEQVVERLEADDPAAARADLERIGAAPADDRTAALRSLREVAEDRPGVVAPVGSALAPLLDDDERPVRLTTAKLFVALAASVPEAVVPAVPALAARLADDGEFYYVRARAAEALGYVALDHPDAVDSPDVLADLRVGLAFDEPEVRTKLAKALEGVAVGDPDRLRHQVSRLAEHLDDDEVLVRYHLATALVAVGAEHPERLAAARDALAARLDDESDHVRGRAAEALGVLAAVDPDAAALADAPVERPTDEDPFVADRMRFALAGGGRAETPDESAATTGRADGSDELPAAVGTREGVRETTADAVDAITAPDEEGECPNCGIALPPGGPPMCPRCGRPHAQGL